MNILKSLIESSSIEILHISKDNILFLSVVTFATMGMLILVLLKVLVQLLSVLDLYKV